MKVKGGGRRKSWEADAALAVAAQDQHLALPGDSISMALNGSLDIVQQQQQQQPLPLTLPLSLPLPPADAHDDADNNDDDVDDDAELDADDDADADDNTERPKLDEGFYEIEAIRRKRVRKGQLQYLIKWRGWPETANTWEPLENLQSCSDVIEAFEDSLRSGKTRKRKRKHGTPFSQPKKRQQRSTVSALNDTALETIHTDKPLSTAALDNLSLANISALPQQGCNGNVNNGETTNKLNVENGLVNVFPRSSGRRGQKEYDPKLSELKTTSTSNADKLGIQFQEAKNSQGNGPTDGISKVHCPETVQNNRSTGAKRRKSGSVKRFKQEPQLSETPVMQNITIGTSIVSGGRIEFPGMGNPNIAGENPSHKSRTDQSQNAPRITKILKPIGYSASVTNNVQDVSVTFMAVRLESSEILPKSSKVLPPGLRALPCGSWDFICRFRILNIHETFHACISCNKRVILVRSDGTEVVVDNKFLKSDNPLLLINFYEQHLRYTATL